MTEIIFEKNVFVFLVWSMVVGFMTSTAANHQVAIETLWLHFGGAVITSIFIQSME